MTKNKHDYSAHLLCDSIAPGGERVTTLELTYPRIVHAELLTHRLFSRCSASSRAIPTPKLLAMIREQPMIPLWWGKNQAGMQASEQLSGEDIEITRAEWDELMRICADYAERWNQRGFHKQLANRVVEPWMFITVIVSATEWDNFVHLRDTWPDPDQPPGPAQPEIAWLGREVTRLLAESTPRPVDAGEWHMPLVEQEDETHPLYVGLDELYALDRYSGDDPGRNLAVISAARCARVSYLTHDGRRDLRDDLDLYKRLVSAGHWSPLEHPARAMPAISEEQRALIAETRELVGEEAGELVRAGIEAQRWSGNFCGWTQLRKLYSNEHRGHAPGDRLLVG